MRALIFDLDDTLLNRSKRVSHANEAALLHAHEAGFRLIIAPITDTLAPLLDAIATTGDTIAAFIHRLLT